METILIELRRSAVTSMKDYMDGANSNALGIWPRRKTKNFLSPQRVRLILEILASSER